MTARYAASTEVPADRSRTEIERTLQRYGASGFMYGWQETHAIVGFTMRNRHVRFVLPQPDPNLDKYQLTPTGRPRSATAARDAWDQDVRQSWRALALVVKAKLEAVEAGIVTFEAEFAMHMVLPGGQMVADVVGPRIEQAYETGAVPELLPMPRPALTS